MCLNVGLVSEPLVGNCCPFRVRCTPIEDDHVTVANMSEMTNGFIQ